MEFMRSRKLERWKMTAFVNLFGLVKIPLLVALSPRFMELTEERMVLKVPLCYRTKNHLNVMYFGALAMGAELSIAATAVDAIQKTGKKIDFLFKDFEGQFLKRADGDVFFTCEQVAQVRALIARAAQTSERVEGKFQGFAKVDGRDEPVMTYQLTLTAKNRSKKT